MVRPAWIGLGDCRAEAVINTSVGYRQYPCPQCPIGYDSSSKTSPVLVQSFHERRAFDGRATGRQNRIVAYLSLPYLYARGSMIAIVASYAYAAKLKNFSSSTREFSRDGSYPRGPVRSQST